MNEHYKEIVNRRRLAFGPEDRLMTMAQVRYPWAIDIYERMQANHWTQKSVAMNDDRLCYHQTLSADERRGYDLALAFVSNLDGIQFDNIVNNLSHHVTSSEVKLALTQQAAEEGLHVRAYQTMIEAVALDPVSIYMKFQTDGVLAAKNEYIMRQSDILKGEPNHANFARAVVANILLEGVYFYSMFLYFYALGKRGLMINSADMIKYIHRDEGGTHLSLFSHIHNTHKLENPEVYDEQFYKDAEQLFRDAVALEINWGKHVAGSGIPGYTHSIVDGKIKCLADERWQIIRPGEKLYGAQDPAPWFEEFSRINGTKKNFFEGKAIDYQADGMEW
jgi:ribonucleoside-diphosphate reductase beta chain